MEQDTNVFRVDLSCLAKETQIIAGDAQFCSNCGGVFNKNSQIEGSMTSSDAQKWSCEFCNTENAVVIEEAEIP